LIFWKYHGIGNDFVLLEDYQGSAPKDPELVRSICDRHRGVGADGILYLGVSECADVSMRIFNADGSEAEMCGNGIRCLAKHVYEHTPLRKEELSIDTLAGVMRVRCHAEEGEVKEVRVNMGTARLDCSSIPMRCEGRFIDRDLEVDGMKVRGTAVSMGNPHFVTLQEFSREEMLTLAPLIERHPLFPRRTNVEFVSVGEELDVKVFERGVGWTLACGTGACAAAVAAALSGTIPYSKETRVRLPGGLLRISVPEDLSSVWMTGPAEFVFKGEIEQGE